SRSIALMRPSFTATLVRVLGAPVPSMRRTSAITRSCMVSSLSWPRISIADQGWIIRQADAACCDRHRPALQQVTVCLVRQTLAARCQSSDCFVHRFQVGMKRLRALKREQGKLFSILPQADLSKAADGAEVTRLQPQRLLDVAQALSVSALQEAQRRALVPGFRIVGVVLDNSVEQRSGEREVALGHRLSGALQHFARAVC